MEPKSGKKAWNAETVSHGLHSVDEPFRGGVSGKKRDDNEIAAYDWEIPSEHPGKKRGADKSVR